MSEQEQRADNRNYRTARVKKLKKLIGIFLSVLLILPTFLCLFLFVKIYDIEKQIKEISVMKTSVVQEQVEQDKLNTLQEQQAELIIEDHAAQKENSNSVNEKDDMEGLHKVYLTFDDGPSIYTDEILDILKEYHVKATFFVVGKEETQYKRIYKRIAEEGHSLGMHSYSHKYWEIYQTLDSFQSDLSQIQNLIYEITGIKPTIMRFPGGSSNNVSKVNMQELISYVEEEGITYYDWNISSGDAAKGSIPTQTILENCMNPIADQNTSIILMHDASDKRSTIEALPMLIEKILEKENTVILPITEDTKPIQHIARQ